MVSTSISTNAHYLLLSGRWCRSQPPQPQCNTIALDIWRHWRPRLSVTPLRHVRLSRPAGRVSSTNRVNTRVLHALNTPIHASHSISLPLELLLKSLRTMLFSSPKTARDSRAPIAAAYLAISVSVTSFWTCFTIPGGPTTYSSACSMSYHSVS